MATSLKSYNKPIRIKISKRDIELQLFLRTLEKEYPEKFSQQKMFNEWVKSMENSIKKGEIHVG